MKVIIIMTIILLFTSFTEIFKILKIGHLIDDIEVDINKVKTSKEDKKVFNDLNKLIIDINNNKVKKEDAVKRLNKSIPDLDQLKQKQNIILRNKMVQAVYLLYNSFGFNKEFEPLFSKKSQILKNQQK